MFHVYYTYNVLFMELLSSDCLIVNKPCRESVKAKIVLCAVMLLRFEVELVIMHT